MGFDLKELDGWLMDHYSRKQARRIIVQASGSSIDFMDASIKLKADPSADNQRRFEQLIEQNREGLSRTQKGKEMLFEDMYGADLLHLVRRITRGDYFLVGQYEPFHLTWITGTDHDNDHLWVIHFNRGKFNYYKETASGYGGRQLLEQNLSHERVEQLIN